MTLMMKAAASFSLIWGLKRPLMEKKKKKKIGHMEQKPSEIYTYILEKFNGLSSEAGQSSVQHQGYQGNHCIHVGASI